MVTYSRAHQNTCPAVHTLTDAARETILSEAARVAQEAQAAENKQLEDDETKRKAAEKQALDAVAAAAKAHVAQAAETKQREDAETKRKAAEKLALDTANESPDALPLRNSTSKLPQMPKRPKPLLPRHRLHVPRPVRMSRRRSSRSRQRKRQRRKLKKCTMPRSCSWPI
jgi:hypothetical protein